MQTINQQQTSTSSAASRWRGPLTWLGPGEPHPVRGPFTRWPRISDAALAIAVFAGSLVAVAVSTLADGEDFALDSIDDVSAAAVSMLALAAASLLLRRRRPLAVAAAVMAIMIGWAVAGYGDGQDLALIVAVYAVGRYATDQRHSFITLVAAIGVSVLGSIVDANQRVDVAPAIVLPWLVWYLGGLIRNRGDYLALLQERAERLAADQHARARQAVADERSRIARELHDVVAHQVSVMTVQAGAAKTIAHDDLDTAIDAMGDVERAGRQALGELRHLLGVLHRDDQDDDLGPQPGIADISAIADEVANTGADVSFAIAPPPAGISAAVELSAYRIVQESLTNVIKHAGPHPAVDLTVGINDVELVINITNTVATSDHHTSAPELPASGYGIAGMRERAALLGGTLTAHHQPPDRFCVVAHIPIGPERT